MSIKKARSSFNSIFDFPDHSFSFESRARTTVFSFFTIFAFLLLFLVMVRWCQQSIFINNAIAPDLIQHADLQRMWIMGLRFDGRTISICLLPAFLSGILLSVRQIPCKLWLWITASWVFVAAFLISILAISNIYYIQTYRTYFEIFVFSFLHESPKAVMTTIWQDYPVIRVVFCCAAFAFFCAWVWQKAAKFFLKKIPEWNKTVFIIFLLIAIILIYTSDQRKYDFAVSAQKKQCTGIRYRDA